MMSHKKSGTVSELNHLLWREESKFWPLLALGTAVAGVGYFYRYFFSSGFTRFQGDFGDGRLTSVIASNWWELATYSSGWRSLGIYYPSSNALGYSDALFISGLLVTPFRLIGLSPALTFQITLIIFSFLSYFFLIKFLREGVGANWAIAISGSFIFTFSNGLFLASNHPQLLYFLLIPIILYLIFRLFKYKKKLIINAFFLGFFIGLIIVSAFYIGFYLILAFLLFLIFFIILTGNTYLRKDVLKALIFAALGGLITLPLFLSIYLPVLAEGKSRNLDIIKSYSLRPSELFNMGEKNLIWGFVIKKYFSEMMRINDGEYSMAPTLLLLVCSFLLLVYLLFTLKNHGHWERISISLLLTGLIFWLLPINFSMVFLWQVVYNIPGADAIRAVGRIHIFAAGLLTLGLIIALSIVWRKQKTSIALSIFMLILLAFLSLEQVNRLPQQNNFLERELLLKEVSSAPALCESFVVTKSLKPDEPNWTTQMDAVVLTQMLKLPTWNGYTGNTPEGWKLLNVNDDAYFVNVLDWKIQNKIENGCGLDLEKNTWLLPNELDQLLN